MSRAKKALQIALKKTHALSDDWFGSEEAAIEDLPSIQRSRRVRKNIFIEERTVTELDKLCAQYNISFTDAANDILTKYVKSQKNKKTG